MTEIALTESIAAVQPGEWDGLGDGNVLASHAYLRLIEETALVGAQPRHYLAHRQSRLQAALTWWIEKPDGRGSVLEDVLFGRLRRLPRALGVRVLPAMNCGGFLCWNPSILFRPGMGGSERGRLFQTLLARAEDEASRADCMICIRNMPAGESDLSEVLLSRGYLRSEELPVCYLDVEWDCFDGYLKWLKRSHPRTAKNIRSELNGMRRAGIMISRLEDPSPQADQLHHLMNAHYQRWNSRPFPYRSEFFQRLKAYLDDRAILHIATLQGQIIATQTMFCANGLGFIPMIGIGDGHVRQHDLYFNLAFNRPIEEAANTGLKRLYFGRMVYGTKLRRGCQLAHAALFVRSRGRFDRAVLRGLLAVRSRRVRSMVAAMMRRD